MVYDSGSSLFLHRTVDFKKAFDLYSMGNRLKATEAVSIGLIKKMLNKAKTALWDEMLDYEVYCHEIAGSSQDYKEGAQAFLEKRKPNF